MGDTNPNFPTREIVIALENAPDNASGTERIKIGDIIAVRPPGSFIGRLESRRYLWLHIDGLEENTFAIFMKQVFEPTDPQGTPYDKRRYCIPLDRLEIVYPALNQTRALDLDDFYQPFLTIDSEDFEILTAGSPFDVNGLIFDKVIGDYI